MNTRLIIPLIVAFLAGCSGTDEQADAFGTFEATEVIVSSESNGRILSIEVTEGVKIEKGEEIALIDTTLFNLQKDEIDAGMKAVKTRVSSLNAQNDILNQQIENINLNISRIENMLKNDAATQKQHDDINTQIAVYQKQIAVNKQQIKVQESTTGTQNRSILSQSNPLKKSVAQIEDQLKRTNIKNPVNGTVLTRYVMAGEFASPGKALYSIGDLSEITLRVYVTGTQFAQIKLNQSVKVFVDSTNKTYKEYPGVITWISDKAEFTPKTIQTKDERANLVYAVKVHVKNDGLLKIGMYGEVKFN